MLKIAILAVLIVTAKCNPEGLPRVADLFQQQENTEIIYDEKDVKEFQKSMRLFSASFFHQVLQESERADDNIVFSPLSISHAMGMVNSAARGNTAKEMMQALHIANDKSNAYVDALMENITDDKFATTKNDALQTKMASRTFYAPGYIIKEQYLLALKQHYNSEMEELSFTPADKAAAKINKWVAENTNNLIKKLVTSDMFTPLTRMVLVNALYFKVDWVKSFKTAPEYNKVFHVPSGDIDINYMLGDSEYKLLETKDYTHVAIPYKDNRTEFVINMPNTKQAMKTLTDESGLAKYFENINKNKLIKRKMKIYMPAFVIEQKTDVKEVLKKLGVKDVFNELKADLSGMSEEAVYVSDLVHKAKIIVDEKGTEAAAASAAVITGRSGSFKPIIHINKPFIYTIIQDGFILFAGRMSDPAT